MPCTPTTKQIDNLIASIANLYLALSSVLFLYVVVGWTQVQRNDDHRSLVALDKLNVIRSIARTSVGRTDFSHAILPEFFVGAATKFWELHSSSGMRLDEDRLKLLFPDTPILGASLIANAPMRTSLRAACSVAVFELSSGAEFQFATFMFVSKLFNVRSENVALAVFSHDCGSGPPVDFVALIFKEGDHIAVALPRVFQRSFPGLTAPYPFKHMHFAETDKLVARLPAALKPYVNLGDQFDFLHLNAIELRMLRHASTKLKRFFKMDELDDAVGKLYDDKQEPSSFFGVSLDNHSILRIGPLVIVVITFELWRRVRRLPTKIRSDQLWFPFDAHDAVGKLAAYLMCFFPLAASLLVYALFSYAQGLGLIVGNRVVSVEGIINWEFPDALGPGWSPRDDWAFLLLLALPLHLGFLVATSKNLIAIVHANAPFSFRKFARATYRRVQQRRWPWR